MLCWGRGDVSDCSGKNTASGRFVIAVVMVDWYNDDQMVDALVVVVDSMTMTVEMVLHVVGGVYVMG